MKTKLIRGCVALALCVCAALLGLLGALGCSLWSENWIMHSMEATGYYGQLAQRVRADCGVLASQTGLLGNIVDPMLPDETVRQDVILLTDALFRGTMAMPETPFEDFAVQVEDIVYDEMQAYLTDEEKQLAQSVQRQCADQYTQSVRPPFQVVLSILLQYRRMAWLLALAASALAAAAAGVLRKLCCAQGYARELARPVLSAAVAVAGLGAAVRCCGYQSWMPAQNLEYQLFVYWFGGLAYALWTAGAVLAAGAGLLMVRRKRRARMIGLKQLLPCWRQWAGAGVGAACLLCLPLYMQNGYIGLVGGKFRLLLVFAGAAAVLAVRLFVAAPRAGLRRLGLPMLWLAGLCAVYTAAACLADDPATAVWGISGRYNGLATLLACMAVYAAVRLGTGAGWRDTLERTMLAAGAAVTALAWLNYWKLDPLAVYYSLRAEDAHMFLSTVGNINFFGGYLCLCVPLALWRAAERPGRGRMALAALLCSGLLIANSEAAWLGAGVCVLAILCSRRMTGPRAAVLCRVGALAALLWLCSALYSLWFPVLAPLRNLSAVLGTVWGSAGTAAVLAAAGVLLSRCKRSVRPLGLVLSVLLAAAGAGALVAVNVFGVSPGGLDDLLRFDQTWGSNRGYVWYVLGLVYERLPLVQKLVGAGGDAVNALLNPHYTVYIQALNGSTFDSAHNEYLQHLLCGGVLGLVCWLGFLVCSVRRALRCAPGLALAIAGYAVQAFFSISMPGVLPLVFVLAALAMPEQTEARRLQMNDRAGRRRPLQKCVCGK